MHKAKLIIALILVSVVLVVIFQNRQPVETKFLFVAITMPKAALIGLTLLVGMAVGILVSLGMTSRKKKD